MERSEEGAKRTSWKHAVLVLPTGQTCGHPGHWDKLGHGATNIGVIGARAISLDEQIWGAGVGQGQKKSQMESWEANIEAMDRGVEVSERDREQIKSGCN